MKHVHYLVLIALSALLLTACEPNVPQAPILDSYPKKQLIEEFTGQDCGYCPYGMNCISEFIANDTNWVLVLHHAGYASDHFTVAGSETITKALKVSGAPYVAINRSKTKFREDGKNTSAVAFNPGNLETASRFQFDETTYASVKIANSYDAETRELKVRVYGALSRKDVESLYLTVLIKESGMVDYQQDYLFTYEGWQEFRHANAIRAFLTEAKGDEVIISKQRYEDQFTITLDEKWNAENCMVVAFLSEEFQPVIQAEQCPVVAGTQGGANIQHGGITAVPVEDYYPEPDAVKGPSDYSGWEVDTLTAAQCDYTAYTAYNFNYWTLLSYNPGRIIKIDNTSCIAFTYIYLFTDVEQTTFPTGTFEFKTTEEPGTAYAGIRDDSQVVLGGSSFYYANRAYFNQGYLVPSAQWLIADGTITINEDGWEVIGHARNGAPIHIVGPVPQQQSKLPFKAPNKKILQMAK